MDQPTATPTQKISASAVSAAAVVFLVWVLSLFGVVMTAEAAAGLVTVVAFAIGYFIRERPTAPADEPSGVEAVEGMLAESESPDVIAYSGRHAAT